jgi:hypothetical protein
LGAWIQLDPATVRLHLVRNQDVVAEYVVAHNFGPDDAADDSARVDADAHVKVLQERLFARLSDIPDDFDHFKANLDDAISFFDLDHLIASVLVSLAGVATYHVAVTDRVHFVDLLAFDKLVELAEELGQKLNYFLRAFDCFRECCEPDHVCVQQCHVVDLLDNSFIILQSSENVDGH